MDRETADDVPVRADLYPVRSGAGAAVENDFRPERVQVTAEEGLRRSVERDRETRIEEARQSRERADSPSPGPLGAATGAAPLIRNPRRLIPIAVGRTRLRTATDR